VLDPEELERRRKRAERFGTAVRRYNSYLHFPSSRVNFDSGLLTRVLSSSLYLHVVPFLPIEKMTPDAERVLDACQCSAHIRIL